MVRRVVDECSRLDVRGSTRSCPVQRAPHLDVDDIAGAVELIVTWPPRTAVNEMIVRPTEQES